MSGLDSAMHEHVNTVAALKVGDFCDAFNDPENAPWREELTEMFLERATEQDQVLSFMGNCCLVMNQRQVLCVWTRLQELHPAAKRKVE